MLKSNIKPDFSTLTTLKNKIEGTVSGATRLTSYCAGSKVSLLHKKSTSL